MPIEVNGQSIETDEEGYLVNRTDWNEDVAKVLASTDNAELSQNHWEVINFLVSFYALSIHVDRHCCAPQSV